MTNLQPANIRTFQLGLVGYPLGHSLSPQIQAAALASCGLGGEYSLFPIHTADGQGLADLLARVRAGEIDGLNVTIPHKQNVVPLLDGLTPAARAIGAVNTVYLKDGSLLGDNTDAPGFLADLDSFLTTKTQRHQDTKSALVLGAGGSARAVVYALVNDGWTVTLAVRRLEQAKDLAARYGLRIMPTLNLKSLTFNLVVNATPVGMSPNCDASPWPTGLPFPIDARIYDLVYNPPETALTRAARAQGFPAINGLGLLVEQAALSFERWTGREPSRAAMRQAAAAALKSSLLPGL